MTSPFDSYAQNGEDVVLMRAFGHLEEGTYVDVGANDPVHFNLTYAFYQRGWSGVAVEPVAEFADALRAKRSRDTVVEAAVTDDEAETVTLHTIPGTGLSTTVGDIAGGHAEHGWTSTTTEVPALRLDTVIEQAGLADRPIHVVNVDVEGAERSVLASIDLEKFRPWVFVVESTLPLTTHQSHDSWETLLTDHGYTATLFDGLSRYYVADEHLEEIGHQLSYPACVLDNFTTEKQRADAALSEQRRAEIDQLTTDLIRWRNAALTRWQEASSASALAYGGELGKTRHELFQMRQTISWRVTRPIRTVRTLMKTLRVGR
ncbi:FkbM family methyltransferase [Jatrophihabitans sp. YIM 134969]